jgi:uncharacterized membrane protein
MSMLMRRVRQTLRDDRGSIGVILAVFLGISLALCALAIDVGSLYLERRTTQGAADLAAIAAASDMDRADAAARATLAANGVNGLRSLAVVKGRYVVDPAIESGLRFVPGGLPHNAVRLDLAVPGHLYFAKALSDAPEISVSAVGAADAKAMFSIGSRLAAVRGGVVNALLGGLFGGHVALSAMDYDALVATDVGLFDFMSALATEAGITAGTYQNVLSMNATVGQVLEAAASTAQARGHARAASALGTLTAQVPASTTIALSSLINAGSLAQATIGHANPGLSSDVNIMSLLTATAALANGQRQVSVNLAGSVPGLLGLTLDIAIGERPQGSGWVAAGQAGATVKTAQMRFRLTAEVGGSGLLSALRIRLPIYLELASAEARLEAVQCQGVDTRTGTATIAARPAAVKAWIGDVSSSMTGFGSSLPVAYATLAQAPLLSISAKAYAAMENIQPTSLTFSQSDVDHKTVKRAEVRDYLTSVVSHLLQTADIRVNLLGLGSVTAIKSALLGLLTPVAQALDPLLASVLELVGVHLGEVDVRVHGIRCGSAVLAG